MRSRIAQGLAVCGLFASLGAAQGPNNSGTALDRSSPKPLPKQIAQKKALPKSVKPKPYQVGTASWYGQYFQGKETASGEPFNMYDLTAAHLTLPLGTRVIDLSYGAAKTLDLKARGLQRVRLDIVEPETVAMLRPVARPE